MSVSIKYKGNEIGKLAGDGIKTLQTGGKYCEDNIVIQSSGQNNTDSGTETWEKIAEVTLSADISSYTLASFDTYRKVMVMMERSAYVSGLDKNIWLRIAAPQSPNYYTVGLIAGEYGYKRWYMMGEVTNLFISSQKSSNNNPNTTANLTTSGVKLLGDTAPSDLSLVLNFTDTSVIQEGDTITVLGVRR